MKYFFRFSPIAILASLMFIFIPESKKEDPSPPLKMPNDWFYMQRAYPSGQINHAVYVDALKQTKTRKENIKAETYWTFAGPYNSGGRIVDVASHANDADILIGSAAGGILRVSPDGSSWESVFDEALSLSIGDIAIAPSDENIIYVGTGEANCGGGSQTYDGVGIYRSADGGDSWEYAGLEESRNIGRIAIHPTDPDIAYVAAMGSLFGNSPDRGIYRTEDGGNSWEKVLYISDSTGGIDLVINPETPEILYAAMWERIRRPDRRSYGGITCGIHKTTDGGDSWTELINDLPSPDDEVGRIGIDISESDPDILYAIYADDIGYFKGIYKTADGGESWTETNGNQLSNCFQSYGWWFGRIEVDPIDPEIAYVIGFDLYKTSNGGNSWDNISAGDVHVDQHSLFIHPTDNDKLLLGNDGGLYLSDNGGNSWEYIDALPITQFYTCEVDEQYPQRLYGGTQDNGTNRTLSGGLDDWEHIYGGDGFYVLVDPLDNSYVYAEYQYGGLGRSTNGGLSFNGATNGINPDDRKNWNTPVVFDPVNPQILYYGSNVLYRSTNRAASWTAISPDLSNGPGINLTFGTITTISVSPVNQEIIYAGTDDGNVWVSDDLGSSWSNINEGLPDRWVTRVAADPVEEETVYVTFSGYRWNEFIPHVFRSEDKGLTWSDISSNLPEIPMNDIIADPEDNHVLYVASDAGVFVSRDLGDNWDPMGINLPLIPVNDLDLHNESRKLIAATYGRSMYTYDLQQDTLTTAMNEHKPTGTRASLSVIPNPVTQQSKVHIDLGQSAKIRLYMIDMTGKTMQKDMSMYLTKGHHVLDFKRISGDRIKSGIYMLVMDTGKGLITERLVAGQ